MEHKVITLQQPYATLVAVDAKEYETRGWLTHYRGPLLIHAALGVGMSEAKFEALCESEPFKAFLAAADFSPVYALPRGAILARVQLVDCLPIEHIIDGKWIQSGERMLPLSYRERMFGHYGGKQQRYIWILKDPERLKEPIPAKGQQGLWTWKGDLPL